MKRVIGVILTVIMVTGLLPLAAVADGPVRFSDLPESHWAYDDVMALASMGVISGYEDGSFQPGKDLTLGEMAKIVSEAFNTVNPYDYSYPEFDPEFLEDYPDWDERGKWYAPYATSIYCYFHTGDDGPGTFGGGDLARRRDVAHVLVNVLNPDYKFDYSTSGYDVPDNFTELLGAKFVDMKDIITESTVETYWHPWFYDDPSHMYVASELGIISGFPDGTFGPFENITRAQFCAMVNRALALR